MAATITNFRSRKQLLDDEKAQVVRQGVLDLGLGEIDRDLENTFCKIIDQRTASTNGWTFIMLSPQQNAAIVDWLATNSKRPQVAMRLWAMCFTAMRMDTGEICITRDEMADRLGIAPGNVSRIMSELASIEAIIRQRDGRRTRYFMNPRVATHTTGKARDRAQESAPPVQLSLVP